MIYYHNDEETMYECPVCRIMHKREEMRYSHDCHGITYRLLCYDCYAKIMDEGGYDGEYYDCTDENIYDEY